MFQLFNTRFCFCINNANALYYLNRKNKNIYILNNKGYDRKPDEISEFGMNQRFIVPNHNQSLSVN